MTGMGVISPEALVPQYAGPGFFETIYGMAFHPFATLSELAKGRPMTGWALAVFALSALTQVASVVPQIAEQTGITRGESALMVGGLYFLLMTPLWFVRAALFSLISGYLDGSGKGPMLFSLMGFCQVPGMLWGIATAIPSVADSSLAGVLPLIGIIWASVLEVAAIREAQGISTVKAVLVFLIPLLALAVAIVASIIVSVSVFSKMTKFPFPGVY